MSAPKTKLFVGHLPDGCTNDDLFNLFSKFGTVAEADVINKYGFVHMSSSDEAEEALNALNNFYFRGSNLSVERSKSKLHPEPGSQGRARGGPGGGGGGFRGRGGPPRGGFSNGYRRFDGPPFGSRGGGFGYPDRGFSSMRMRPYPSPYDRPSPSMGPPRDEYGYGRSPYSDGPSRDPYSMARSSMSELSRSPRDLYERRPTAYPSASDYLYSRRSPSSYGDPSRSLFDDGYGDSSLYNDGYGDSLSRMPPTASRRPYF